MTNAKKPSNATLLRWTRDILNDVATFETKRKLVEYYREVRASTGFEPRGLALPYYIVCKEFPYEGEVMKLIIKGTPEQARLAAHNRGLDIRVESDRDCGSVVAILTTPLDARIEASVVKWFCEDMGERPFPNGSLLWYSGKVVA